MEETRTLYYQNSKGQWFKATIPALAKVTFGPLIPGQGREYGQTGLYLRIYKTKDHQLGVIPDVVQFRDASLELYEPDLKEFIPVTEDTYLGNMVEKELGKDESLD